MRGWRPPSAACGMLTRQSLGEGGRGSLPALVDSHWEASNATHCGSRPQPLPINTSFCESYFCRAPCRSMHSNVFCINAASCMLSAHISDELAFLFCFFCFSAAVYSYLKVTSLPDKISAEMFSKTVSAGSPVWAPLGVWKLSSPA